MGMVGSNGKIITGRGKDVCKGRKIGETWCAFKNLKKRSHCGWEISTKGKGGGCRGRKRPLLEVLRLGVWIVFLKTQKFMKRVYEAK